MSDAVDEMRSVFLLKLKVIAKVYVISLKFPIESLCPKEKRLLMTYRVYSIFNIICLDLSSS